MKVRRKDRLAAQQKLHDTNQLYRATNVFLQRFLFRLAAGVLSRYKRNIDFLPWLRGELSTLVVPLGRVRTGAQVAAYIRASKITGATIQLDQLSAAVESIRKRAQLSPEKMTELYLKNKGLAATPVAQFTTAVEKKLLNAILDITQKGLHVKEGAVEITKALEAAGVTPQNSFHAEALFRTQTQFAYSSAQWQANENPFIQDLLWGYRYVTVGDDRVRPEHAALEGVTAPKDDPIWNEIWTPNGWACRCQIVEIWSDEVKEHEIVYPPDFVEVRGKMIPVGPDKGFDFNVGKLTME